MGEAMRITTVSPFSHKRISKCQIGVSETMSIDTSAKEKKKERERE